ncbi:MAG: helix-turn-helix domain-containing protein [bacterium]|nr:helix-turn-helix domain-containing protein [bacterium]
MNKFASSKDLSNTSFQTVGLNEQESRFYVAALKLGKSPISRIAREAGLNRSSSYAVIRALAQRGLVSRVKESNGLIIIPISPTRLLDIHKEQQATLESQVDYLQRLFAFIPLEPGVQLHEGKEGLKTVLNSILNEAKEICVFGDGDAFRKMIPGWGENYSKRRSAQKIQTRLLLKATPETIGAAKYLRSSEVDDKKGYSKIRLLPESLGIKGGFDVYNNKVVLYSFEERNVAVIVESKMISSMMKAIFEMLWSMAEGYERTLVR